MPNGSSLFIADFEEPALAVLSRSHGLWTAHSGAKENHEEERAEEKGSNYNLYSLGQLGGGLWRVRKSGLKV